MSVRYLSAERTIAAAGAAFACPDEDFSIVRRAHSQHSGIWAWFKRKYLKALIALGLVLA